MAIHCGHVYHLHLPIAGKYKLIVPAYIVPDDNRVRFFVINTNRTNYQINNPNIANHVVPLSAESNQGFLTHNSWLTCNEAIGGYTSAEIEAIDGCYRGALDDNTIALVPQIIQQSRLYSEIEKTRILEQWPQI